jgi:hypothetical protein
MCEIVTADCSAAIFVKQTANGGYCRHGSKQQRGTGEVLPSAGAAAAVTQPHSLAANSARYELNTCSVFSFVLDTKKVLTNFFSCRLQQLKDIFIIR